MERRDEMRAVTAESRGLGKFAVKDGSFST
jgi:hypothetical protein